VKKHFLAEFNLDNEKKFEIEAKDIRAKNVVKF